jgi:Tfp pilus assembly protein FimT
MTLVELLVVLGVIGLVLGMSVPGLMSYSRQLRLKATSRQLTGLVTLARSLAISSRQNHAVVIDPEALQIRVVNTVSGQPLEQVVRLPKTLTVDVQTGGESSGDLRLEFRPSGALTSRTVSVVLADDGKEQVITVTGATGAISVQ